jgi:hypothetical protein
MAAARKIQRILAMFSCEERPTLQTDLEGGDVREDRQLTRTMHIRFSSI